MNSTAFFEHGQLFLNLSIPLKLDFQNPVKALHTLLWSLDYSCFSKQKKVSGRPNALSPRKMMFILACEAEQLFQQQGGRSPVQERSGMHPCLGGRQGSRPQHHRPVCQEQRRTHQGYIRPEYRQARRTGRAGKKDGLHRRNEDRIESRQVYVRMAERYREEPSQAGKEHSQAL